ncbi:MAG: hypothetical protein JWL63_2180 [Rhodocyclales bacterium]|nr:hypothetical protein [Rhodocyclales bacterium]
MKLIRLTLRNFMPYKGNLILEFPQDLSRNTLLVLGDNMRGKTSLLNGIRWAFYGKAQGRHLRSIPLHQMPNREAVLEGDWTMEARIEFEAAGSRYDLRREAQKRPYVAHPSRPEDFQVLTYLYKNGAALDASSIEAEINRFAPEQVSRFFLFDGELLQEYEELLIEGSDQGKRIKEAIEQALGVPALTNCREDLSVLLKRAQKEQLKEAVSVKGLEAAAESCAKWSAKRDEIETDLAKLKAMQLDLKSERQQLEDEIAASESIYKQRLELDTKVARESEIQKEQKAKMEQRMTLLSEAWRELIKPKILEKKTTLQRELDEAIAASAQRSKLQYKIEHLREHLASKVCPTCGQTINLDMGQFQRQQLQEAEAEMDSMQGTRLDASSLSQGIKTLDAVLVRPVKDRLIDLDRDLEILEVDLSKIATRIDELNEELNGQGSDEILRKKSRFNQALKDEERLKVSIEGREKEFVRANVEVQTQTLRMNSTATSAMTRATNRTSFFKNMHDIFESSVDNLRSTLRSTVEKNATEAFLAMSTQKAYLGLSINANYGLSIIGSDGQSVPLRSAGAEQIVALSLIDGLSRAGRTAGPVVMDTPFGRLDTKHRRNILRYLPDAASQLVLFVHDGEIGGDASFDAIAHRIGARYEIKEVTQSHSVLEKVS